MWKPLNANLLYNIATIPDMRGFVTVAVYSAAVVRKGRTAMGRLEVNRPWVTLSARL